MARRFARKVRRAAKAALYELGLASPPNPPFHLDDEAAAQVALAQVQPYSMVTATRLVSLWTQVRHLDACGTEGSLVECGTWRGGAAAMMAVAHLASGPASRQLHLFDSFQGLPEPSAERDGAKAVGYAGGAQKAAGRLSPIGADVASEAQCRHTIQTVARYPDDLTRYHVGWFQTTVAPAAAQLGPVALLRLDGDWYESTLICLRALYPLVVPGGFVVIDDFGHWEGCRRAVREYLRERYGGEPAPFLHRIDATGRYVVVEAGDTGPGLRAARP